MINNLFFRIGTFFILIGCGLLIVFIGSIYAKEFNLLYLLFTVLAFVVGIGFRRLVPPPKPTRFSSIRKVSQRSRQQREEKQSQKE